VQKKQIEQKRITGRHLLTFESQKLNCFGKKWCRHFYIVFEPCPVLFPDF